MNSMDKLARKILRLEREVHALGRTPQLAYSSIEGGDLVINDDEGNQVGFVGPSGIDAPGVVHQEAVDQLQLDITSGDSATMLHINTRADALLADLQAEMETRSDADIALHGRVDTAVTDFTTGLATKSKHTLSPDLPGTASNNAGDVWERHKTGDTTKIIGRWRGMGGTTWSPMNLDATYIPQLDIGTGTFGDLSGTRIQVSSIGVSKLVVSNFDNLIGDPNFLLLPGAGFSGSYTIQANGNQAADGNAMVLAPNASAIYPVAQPSWNIKTENGAAFRLRSMIHSDLALPSGVLLLRVRFFATDGTTVDLTPPGGTSPAVAAGSWVELSGTVVTPSDKTYYKCGFFYTINPHTTQTIKIAQPSMTRAADGKLIVDGSVLAKHIDVSSLNASGQVVVGQSQVTGLPAALNALVKGYVTEYAVNSSETVAPTTGWSTATPTRTPGTFIWYRVTVTYHNNTTSTTSPALLTGNTGAQGSQGIPGTPGADGTTYYTWLKYADTPTTGMADDPTGKTYMGIAVGKTSATESTNYADYTWSLIKGADGSPGAAGRGVSSTAVTYQVGTSGTTAPTGTWTSTIPATTTGQYLWTRTITTYTDATTSTAYSVAAHGATGSAGAAGKGISSTAVTYQVGTSGTTAPTGTWSSTIPATSPGQYLWTRTITTYTDATTTTAYAVAAHGATGQQGIQGAPGADGQPTYTWVKYATDATGSSMSDDPTGRAYIGFAYNKLTQTESTNPTDYTWSLIQGAAGANGTNGADGVSVTAVTPYYAQVTAGAVAPAKPTVATPPAPWVATEPAYADNTEMYRTEKISFSNGTFAYTNVVKSSSYQAAVALKTLWGLPTDTTLINGGKLANNTVLTQHIAVADWTDYVGDPWFKYGIGAWWGQGTTDGIFVTTLADGTSGPAMRMTGSGATKVPFATYTATKPGEKFYVTADAKHVSGVGGSVRIEMISRTATGVVSAQQADAVTGSVSQRTVASMTSGTWYALDGYFTVPAGAVEVYFRPVLTSAATAGEAFFTNMHARRRNGGELIVDGAIDGKTITGAVLQTASSGNRMVFSDSMRGYSGLTGELRPARLDIDGSAGAFYMEGANFVGSQWPGSTIQIMSTGGGGSQTVSGRIEMTGPEMIFFYLPVNTSPANKTFLMAASNLGLEVDANIVTNVFGTAGGFYDRVWTGGGGTAANINNAGRIIRGASSQRYKRNIETLTLEDAMKVLAPRSVTFQWNEDMEMGDRRVPGFLAEEMDDAGADLWVTYENDGDDQGRPDGVRYQEVTAAHNVILKDVLARLEALETTH